MPKANGHSEFKIDKDVPLPGRFRAAGPSYPWPKMKAGDSVFIPRKHGKFVHISAHQWAKRHGRKFTTHKEANGVRIWRVA